MARKKRPPDDKEQSARFKETAKQMEGEGEAFKEAMKAILKPGKEKKKGKPK